MGKRSFFSKLTITGMNALNRIGRIHDFANGTPIVKELFDMAEVPFPDTNRSRIGVSQLFERFKCTVTGF